MMDITVELKDLPMSVVENVGFPSITERLVLVSEVRNTSETALCKQYETEITQMTHSLNDHLIRTCKLSKLRSSMPPVRSG